jgi:hypothetical protein
MEPQRRRILMNKREMRQEITRLKNHIRELKVDRNLDGNCSSCKTKLDENYDCQNIECAVYSIFTPKRVIKRNVI